jgi:hypothetical protein
MLHDAMQTRGGAGPASTLMHLSAFYMLDGDAQAHFLAWLQRKVISTLMHVHHGEPM